jgi:hypothetical protein
MRYESLGMRRGVRLGILALLASMGPLVVLACGSSAGNFYEGADAGSATEAPDTSPALPTDSSPAQDAPIDTGADMSFDATPLTWPDCKSQPPNTVSQTIPDIWQSDDTSTPKGAWLQNVHITAISGGACKTGFACQIYVQDGSYATLAAGAHHAIKIFASGTTSKYFTSLAVGDQVDASGFAWRYTLGGQHELLLEVNVMLPGCANKKGTAPLTPVTGVSLSDFTVDHYENTYGPLLVNVANVSGKYLGPPTVTFGLFATGYDGGFPEGGTDIVSVSPYFLANGQFTGLSQGATTSFQAITGIFDVFYAPATDGGAATKYLELGPRTSTDMPAN